MQDKDTHGQTAEADDQGFCLFCMDGKAQQKQKSNRIPENRAWIIIKQVGKSVMDQIEACFFDAEIIEDGQKQHQNAMKLQRHMDGEQHGILLCFDCTKAAKEGKEQPGPETKCLRNILLYAVAPLHG